MSPQDSRPEPPAPSAGSGQDLRQQAEGIAQEKVAQSSGDLAWISTEKDSANIASQIGRFCAEPQL